MLINTQPLFVLKIAAMLQKTWLNSIITPIKSSSLQNTADVVSVLHDHQVLISLSPIVTRYEIALKQDTKSEYSVWENVGFVPLRKEINFTCWYENQFDRVISRVQAPGLVSKSTLSVRFRSDQATGDDEEGWLLHEEIESTCNLLVKGVVEKTMLHTRKAIHPRIIEEAKRRERC